MPKRNGTAAGGFAEQSSDSVFKSSEKYFLRMAGSKGGIPL